MADAKSTLPVTDSADGLDGATAPAQTIQVGGKDPSGDLQTLNTDASGNLITVSKIALTPSAATAVSVGVASTSLVAANASRKGLIVTNISANKISLNLLGGAAVLNTGITLFPGWIWEMDEFSFTTNAIDAIASVAATVITIQEFS